MNTISQGRVQKALRKRLDFHQIQRAAEVQYCLGISVLTPGNLSLAGLMELMEQDDLPAERRSGLVLLVLAGSYPLLNSFESVCQGLLLGRPAQALALAYELTRGSKSRTQILQLDRDVIDVTRYSAARRISGIPRVVKNLAFSPSFSDVSLAVWENGVLGLSQRLPRGKVGFPKTHWRRSHERSDFLVLLYLRLASRLLVSSVGVLLLKFVELYVRPHLRKFRDKSRQPKHCILLTDQTVFLAEVPSEEISKRLLVWKRVFPELRFSVIVHDFLPLSHPEYFSAATNREHLWYLELLAQSDRLFVATEGLERESDAWLTKNRDRSPLVSVIPLPISLQNDGTERSHTEQQDPYFLFIGGFERRKGLSDLVRYMEFVSSQPIPFRIVVIGAPWPGQGAGPWQIVERALESPSVFSLEGTVDDRELSKLIAGAKGLLYLSHAEGYGLPVLEALSLGKLVITQDTPSNRELAARFGGVWHHFRFDDLGGYEAMVRLSTSSNPFEELSVPRPRISGIPADTELWAESIRRITAGSHIED